MLLLRAQAWMMMAKRVHRTARWLYSPTEVSTTIAAPRGEVFATIADPRTYPDWLAGAQHIRSVDAGFPAPGTAFHHEVGPTPEMTIDDKTISMEVHAPERLDLEVHAGPISGRVDFLVQPSAAGTRVVLRERPRGLWWLALPLLRAPLYARNRASLGRLRRRFDELESPV